MCENAALMAKRNLSILLSCQLISATGAIVLVTLGGIIGSGLAGNRALATLPVSVMVISVAATTIPATLLMRAIGRKLGSALASLSAAASALMAAYAVTVSSFPLFIAATAIFGINMAFTQQYRYAAVESVKHDHAGRAISIVLLGAIGGAFVGPELVKHAPSWLGDVPYELRSLANQMTGRYPEVAFLRGTPALWLVDVSNHILPLFRPKTIMRDSTPSMVRLTTELADAR